MSCPGKPSDFRDPNTVKLCIRRNAVIVVVGHLAIFIVFRIKAHIALAVLQRILGIDPPRSRPVARKACTRRNVDDIEKRTRIIQGICSRVAHIFSSRIDRIDRVARPLGVIVETVIEAIVELFHVADERTVLVGFLVLVDLEGKKLTAHTVLDIRNFAFHHVGHQVVALTSLNRQALVSTELSRISQLSVRLLIQDGFRIKRLVLTDTLARNERARTAQGLLAVGSQVLVMRKADVVPAISQVKFFKVRRIGKVSVEHVAFLVADFTRECRTFKASFVTFNNVTLDRRIPVVVRGIIEADITHVVTLLLVTTELRCQKTRLAAALQGSDNHREHRHGHIGNVQHHRTRGNGFLGFDHHASAIEIKVLVRRIVTGTKVTTRNLNSLVRKPAHFHAVQLLVVLIGGRIVDFTDAAFHIVLEAHARQRRVLGFTEHRVAARRQNAVFLVEHNRIGIQGRRAVLELGAIVQVKGRLVHIVNEVHRTVFDGIDTGRVIHPVDLGRVLFFLHPFFEFKAGHLLAESGRSGDGHNP